MSSHEQHAEKAGLKKRILSGLVLAPLTCAVIVLGGWYFAVMVVAAAMIGLYEWYRLSSLCEKAGDQYLTMIPGAIYLALSAMSFMFLRFAFDQGAWLVLSAILCVWASDTGAYFVGRKVGGPKLLPSVSPKKTWSGFGGAMFFCGLALVILAGIGDELKPYINTETGVSAAHIWPIFFIGCGLGAVGQAGDLLISFFKRRVKIKDTGDLIPGHGGLLDRIDSLLLVSPFFLIVTLLWM